MVHLRFEQLRRIRLDARVDQPWLRDGFRHPDLRVWVAERRPDLIWAAGTIGRAWLHAGRPEASVVLGMFERWARVLGGLLTLVGIPGFLANLESFYDQVDAEGLAWRAFVTAWWARYDAREVGVSELWSIITAACRTAVRSGPASRGTWTVVFLGKTSR